MKATQLDVSFLGVLSYFFMFKYLYFQLIWTVILKPEYTLSGFYVDTVSAFIFAQVIRWKDGSET